MQFAELEEQAIYFPVP